MPFNPISRKRSGKCCPVWKLVLRTELLCTNAFQKQAECVQRESFLKLKTTSLSEMAGPLTQEHQEDSEYHLVSLLITAASSVAVAVLLLLVGMFIQKAVRRRKGAQQFLWASSPIASTPVTSFSESSYLAESFCNQSTSTQAPPENTSTQAQPDNACSEHM